MKRYKRQPGSEQSKYICEILTDVFLPTNSHATSARPTSIARNMELFRPKPNVSLFYDAVQDSGRWETNTFATFLIRFAIKNDVDSSLLLDSVCGKNPLHAAVEKGNDQLIEQILKYATDHGRRNAALLEPDAEHDETPFQLAIKKWDIRSMNAIFRFGLDNAVDAVKMLSPNMKGRTALHFAIKEETSSYTTTSSDVLRAVVTLAKDNGVDFALLFQADSDGKTLLHLAACKKYLNWVDSVIKLAKECGVCAKSLIGPDATGNSPLHYAAMINAECCVNAILNFAKDSGVDAISLFHPNVDRRTPLHCATMNYHFDTVSALLSWAMSNEVPVLPLLEADSKGHTPLHLLASIQTIFYFDKEALNEVYLINRRGQLPIVDQSGEMLNRLVRQNVQQRITRRILQSAVALGNDGVQTILAPDGEGQTPLHLAARNGHESIVSVILQSAVEHGSPVHANPFIVESEAIIGKEMAQTILAPDKCGNTPLKLALESSSDSICTVASIIRFALDVGIDWKTLIDIQDAAHRSKLKEIFYKQIIREPWIWPALVPSQSRTTERSKLSETGLLPDDVLSRNIIWTNEPSIESKDHEMWQRVQKIVEGVPNQQLEPTEKCQMISRQFQALNRNWKTGNYEMKFESGNPNLNDGFEYDDDHILLFTDRTKIVSIDQQFKMINRRTMKTGHAFNGPQRDVSDFQIHENIIVVASNHVITVFDAKTAYQVNEIDVPNNWKVVNLCFKHGILVALSEVPPNTRQLTVWRVNCATDIQHLVDLPTVGDEDEKRTTNVAIDERYIVVFLQTEKTTKIDFFSTKSLSFEFSQLINASESHVLQYHRGLLIMQKENCVRLMDVRTGYCREINLEPFGLSSECTQIRANSKYLVVINGQAEWTKVGIFDLYANGEMTGERCNTPLSRFEVPFKVIRFEMDETELICVGDIPFFGARIVVIDFLSTPPNMETGRTTSSGSLSNGDATAWRLTVAKEISETLMQ